MKPVSRLIIAVLLVAASSVASAHGRIHFGVHVGPYWGPWWVVPPVYYTPIVVENETPMVIEQTTPPTEYWYYCRPANAYYPYARECPVAWEKVPAQPATQP
jgi:hypothetical protein